MCAGCQYKGGRGCPGIGKCAAYLAQSVTDKQIILFEEE